MRLKLRADEEGDIGIGTLIIFIAIVLVAAIAASLILYAAAMLQQQAQKTVDDAVREVSGGLTVVNIAGDRNPDGEDSTMVSGYMPFVDDQEPIGGVLLNVTASRDGVSPLRITINWSSAQDYGSGMAAEILYRTSVYDPTNPASVNEQVARNRLLTLDQLDPSLEIARFEDGFDALRQYVDYTVRDDNSTSYAYAIVAVDGAGNMVLYAPLDSSASTSDTTTDEDLTAPSGGSMTSFSRPDQYSVSLFWVPSSDSGSGIEAQRLYRSDLPVSSPPATTVDGRRVLALPDADLIGEFNSSTSSYVDSPPSTGTFVYFVVAEDRSGNQYFTGSISVDVTDADAIAPSPVQDLTVNQGIQAVVLAWSEASDAQTSVNRYLVFRSTAASALDSIEELKAMSPLAELDSGTLHYSDYSGAPGTLYYYTVVAVDAAGNYANPVIPANTIQMIEIKVKVVPGSDPILFSSLMIEVSDGEVDKTLMFNSSIFGPEGADSEHFSVQVLRDPDGVFMSTLSLTDGALVKIFVDAGEIGLNLHAESTFNLKFIPTIGQPTWEECNVPYLGSYRYVQLV